MCAAERWGLHQGKAAATVQCNLVVCVRVWGVEHVQLYNSGLLVANMYTYIGLLIKSVVWCEGCLHSVSGCGCLYHYAIGEQRVESGFFYCLSGGVLYSIC